MDYEKIIKALPIQPSEEHIAGIKAIAGDDFKDVEKGYLYFKRELIPLENSYSEVFGWDFGEDIKTVYGARCKCSHCGETFYAGYKNSDKYRAKEIILAVGEDGNVYPGYITSDEPEAVEFGEGDELNCPFCDGRVTCEACSEFRDEEVKALRTQQIVNVDGYAAVITWVYQVYFERDEVQADEWLPVRANVINENGRLRGFYFYDKWEIDEVIDGLQETYEDCESLNETKIGGFVDDELPELNGTTGEKTGLKDYIEKGGTFPDTYLMTWQEHKNIENLMKSDFGPIFAEVFDGTINDYIGYSYFPTGSIASSFNEFIDYSENKPHKMLGMTRPEFAETCKYIKTNKDFTDFIYLRSVTEISAAEFQHFNKLYGSTLLYSYCGKASDLSLEKIERYLIKQNANNRTGFEMFLDYHSFCAENGITDLTFPRSLSQAHDRMSGMKEFQNNKSFSVTLEKYKSLEWTDGELCIRLPRTPNELIDEGNTLRHCVGTYVNQHSEGNSVIFFVRHYRRPERSYYTLNINFSKFPAREVQLHGYGNERHGKNKEYSHKIPHKVRAFVDRWEAEVLKPFSDEHVKQIFKDLKSA